MESISISIIEQQAFTKITNRIYSVLTTLYLVDDVKVELEKLDIEASLRVMDSLINDLHTLPTKTDSLRKAVKYMMNGAATEYIVHLSKEGHLVALNNFVQEKTLRIVKLHVKKYMV